MRRAAGALLLTIGCAAGGQEIDQQGFLTKRWIDAQGGVMPYRLFVPRDYDASRRYPLVLWLHGASGRGDDNLRQISGGNLPGSHVWTRPESQSDHPCFVLAPQCPLDETWASDRSGEPTGALRRALDILEATRREYSIDADRLYVSGQSMGGFGALALVGSHPDLFAAAVPLCGGADPSRAAALSLTPIWIFHGAADPVVPVAGARRLVAAIRQAGGAPRYTEYEGEGHPIWDRVFADPELREWVFAQKRGATAPDPTP